MDILGGTWYLRDKCIDFSDKSALSSARTLLRQIFEEIGLEDQVSQALLLTIIDELGNNILRHGRGGRLCLSVVKLHGHTGFRMLAEDKGGGIKDLELALKPGFSSDKGMGMGLNLLKALADDLRIANLINGGAYIEVWKWI